MKLCIHNEDIPIFATISARVTFQVFERKPAIDDAMFLIPDAYVCLERFIVSDVRFLWLMKTRMCRWRFSFRLRRANKTSLSQIESPKSPKVEARRRSPRS